MINHAGILSKFIIIMICYIELDIDLDTILCTSSEEKLCFTLP